jgi:MOSC domain-containing protein YiiM
VFSDYREWEQLSHASDYWLFPENMGKNLSIDETCLSSVEVYTFLINKEGHGGPGTLVLLYMAQKQKL